MAGQQKDRGRMLARSSKEIKRYRTTMRTLLIILPLLLTLVVLLYIVSIMYTRFGSYTVTVNKFDGLKYGLSLSETPDFLNPVERLNNPAVEEITNISGKDLPKDLDQIDGSHNGENYLAYTYYCKNTGEATVTYEYYLYMVNVTNDVDAAARVMLYVDGVPTTYARTASDGSGPEPGTTAFSGEKAIVRKQIENFAPGDMTKFTIVIWLEGDDPECKDDIIGGQFKIDMSMSIIADQTGKETESQSASETP